MGVTHLRYRERDDCNLRAAGRTSCTIIRELVARVRGRPESQMDEVPFWHSIPDRHAQGVDVRSLIAGCSGHAIISTLSYVAHYCKKEIVAALRRGVIIRCIIAKHTADPVAVYSRHSPLLQENLPIAHKRYLGLVAEFRALGVGNFSVFGAASLMTHSIGHMTIRSLSVNSAWIRIPHVLRVTGYQQKCFRFTSFRKSCKRCFVSRPCWHRPAQQRILNGEVETTLH